LHGEGGRRVPGVVAGEWKKGEKEEERTTRHRGRRRRRWTTRDWGRRSLARGDMRLGRSGEREGKAEGDGGGSDIRRNLLARATLAARTKQPSCRVWLSGRRIGPV
jgi:hypothetical protein